MKRIGLARSVVALAAIATIVGACSTGGASPAAGTPGASADASAPASGGATGSYVIGVSNTLQGNGWREEMICSAKAQALASGQVSKMVIAHRTTDAAGQLEDIRTLISAGVNAIIVNPVNPDAVNAALKEAIDKGITVVAVDMGVNEPNAYLMSNDQVQYGYLGAKWLFEQMGGKGNVVYQRGIAGAQADTDRDTGFKKALSEHPDIKVVAEQATNWDPATAVQQINEFLASGQQVDGVWTSGVDSSIVNAFKTANKPFVPIVGADNSEFVSQLTKEEGLVGAAVTNPAAVGGAGVELALRVLNGQAPAEKQVLLTPEVWDNQTADGKAKLEAAVDPQIDPLWPLNISIPDWTTYTKDQLLACKGPGE
jgi:ribose transport system substrate-binding protein